MKFMDKAEDWVCKFTGKTYSAAVVIFTGLLVYGMVFLAGCATTPNQNIPQAVIDWAESNTYRVVVFKGKAQQGAATGWWLDDRYLVTACHVVKDLKVATVENRSKSRVLPVKVVACDKENDIALLEYAEPEKIPLLPTEIAEAKLGNRIYSGGYSLGHLFNIATGYWQYPAGDRFGISADTLPGDSGSAVLIYKDGKVYVVGIRLEVMAYRPVSTFGRVGTRHSIPHLASVIGAKQILKFIRENT